MIHVGALLQKMKHLGLKGNCDGCTLLFGGIPIRGLRVREIGGGIEVIDRLPAQTLRCLQAAAYLGIILWGFKGAAEILVPVLMGLLLAFCFLPVPNWLMQRFALGKRTAIALTSTSVGALIVGTAPCYWKVEQSWERLPVYEVHFISLYQNVANCLHARGIEMPAADLARATGEGNT